MFALLLADAGSLLAVVGVFLGIVIAYFAIHGLMIHIAAWVLGFSSGWGSGFRAALWDLLISIGLSVVVGLVFPPGLAVVALLSLTLAIMTVYSQGFFKSLVAAILSRVVGLLLLVAVVSVLLLAFGKKMNDVIRELDSQRQQTELRVPEQERFWIYHGRAFPTGC